MTRKIRKIDLEITFKMWVKGEILEGVIESIKEVNDNASEDRGECSPVIEYTKSMPVGKHCWLTITAQRGFHIVLLGMKMREKGAC